MGKNYYVALQPPCECCGRPYEEKHIGKSSAGWCFSLRVYPDEGINTLQDWQKFWEGKTIKNEYGDVVSEAEMLDAITNRSSSNDWSKTPYMYSSWSDFHNQNHSQQGDKGLLRHRVDNRFCIGHGEGTYDYLIGEFS